MRAVFIIAVLVGLGVALVTRWTAVRRDVSQINVGLAVAAFAIYLVGEQAGMLSWRAVLADLGSPLPARAAARILFVGQLGKYVPGSVWPIMAQMEMSRDVGVPRIRAAAASLIWMAVSVVAAGLVALLCLPALAGAGGGDYALLLLTIPVGALCLHPGVLNRLLALCLRLLRRPPLDQQVTGRGMLVVTGWWLVGWLIFGTQAVVLTYAVAGGGLRIVPLAAGGFALATVAGFLFVVAPAGAGVREAVLVLVLGTAMSTTQAAVVAVLSRLVATGADITVAGVAAWTARTALRRRTLAAESAAALPSRVPPP